MEKLIQAVVLMFQSGYTLEQMHNTIVEKGWTSDNAFLAIKAGENLYLANKKQEELNNRQ